MTNHVIDNSLKNLGKTVLWQYDKAVRLLSLLKHMQVLFHCAVEQFWSVWISKVLAIDSCGDFGCTLWGMFLGVPRPTIVDETGETRVVAAAVYRRILKGAFYLMKASGSFESLQGYLEIVFGIDGKDSLSKWSATVSEYGWTTNVDEINGKYEAKRAYPEGYVFWYDYANDGQGSNWVVERNITESENTSFEEILRAGIIAVTNQETTAERTSDTVMLELIDPEGTVRKIGGAPGNSLSVSVSYEFGETTITATAVRSRKCGVSVVDNGHVVKHAYSTYESSYTITYEKTVFYEQMHKDQKALFEQHRDEFCPRPLGVGSLEDPTPIWQLGLDADRYPNSDDDIFTFEKRYEVGDMFILGKAEIIPAGMELDGEVHYYPRVRQDRWDAVNKTIQQGVVKDVGEYIHVVRAFTAKGYNDLNSDCCVWVYYSLGNKPFEYQSGIFLPKGLVMVKYSSPGEGYLYEVLEPIEKGENTSFEAISSRLRTINHYRLFYNLGDWVQEDNSARLNMGIPGGISNEEKPYLDLRDLQYPYIVPRNGDSKTISALAYRESQIKDGIIISKDMATYPFILVIKGGMEIVFSPRPFQIRRQDVEQVTIGVTERGYGSMYGSTNVPEVVVPLSYSGEQIMEVLGENSTKWGWKRISYREAVRQQKEGSPASFQSVIPWLQ